MVLPILVTALASEAAVPDRVTQALWLRVLAARQQRRRASASASASAGAAPGSSAVRERDRLLHKWSRACRLPMPRARKWQVRAPRLRATALTACVSPGQRELLRDCERLMRQLLRRSRADLSRSDRQAIQLATRQFDSRQATIPLDPACVEGAVWLLTAMHWWGYQHPGALDREPSHPPTGLVRWLAKFRPSEQTFCPREILAMLPGAMWRMEYRSRVLVADMIARRGVVALLPELLPSVR
jgi:hypothetical protein